MTATWEYMVSRSTYPDGLTYFSLLYNGSPLMASTPDAAKVEAFLASQVEKAKAARRAVRVLDWNGDTATLSERP